MRIFGRFRRTPAPVRVDPVVGRDLHAIVCPTRNDAFKVRCSCPCVKCYDPDRAGARPAEGLGCVCPGCTYHGHHKERP